MSRCSCGKLFVKIKYSDKKCPECLVSICELCKNKFSHTLYNHGSVYLCSPKCLYEYSSLQSPNEFSSVIKDAFIYKCAMCSFSNIVQFHHIIPLSEGGPSTIENCIPLCPNHHAEYHIGLISKEDMMYYRKRLNNG